MQLTPLQYKGGLMTQLVSRPLSILIRQVSLKPQLINVRVHSSIPSSKPKHPILQASLQAQLKDPKASCNKDAFFLCAPTLRQQRSGFPCRFYSH
eukprot:1158875-Pelagomonas_calceolata.AAC.4